MVQFVFTPWRNRAELLLVRQHLFPTFTTTSNTTSTTSSNTAYPSQQQQPWWTTPTELTKLEQAIARVFLWTHRGNCPHVVESTALLLSALVLDDRSNNNSNRRNSSNNDSNNSNNGAVAHAAVVSSYVVAFTRFVTGLLDGHQDKARKLSMYGVARTLGLPAGFVELRHQGTHEPMPGLARLRPAARAALWWIWEYYWRNLLPVEEWEMREVGVASSLMGGGGGGGGGGGDGDVVVAKDRESAAMSAFRGRMCRTVLLEYLQRRREVAAAAREGLMRQLRHWEVGLVVATLADIGATTRDPGMLMRSVQLARAILGEETVAMAQEEMEGGEKEENDDGGLESMDEAALRQELVLAQSKAERLGARSQGLGWGSGTGTERKIGGDEEGEDEDRDRKRGGWFKQKGPWVPKPIGVL
ncbi:unnamed protein product [Discula destructiva]